MVVRGFGVTVALLTLMGFFTCRRELSILVSVIVTVAVIVFAIAAVIDIVIAGTAVVKTLTTTGEAKISKNIRRNNETC